MCDVVDSMVNSAQNEYKFYVDYHNLDRGPGQGTKINTQQVTCWKIVENQLEKQPDNLHGVFSDCETYMVKWRFQFEAEGELLDETLFFFWKGQNATKGYSPLPAEFENEQTIVERVVQWSEPPVFFRIFDDVITMSGNDGQSNRLFMFRGELEGEIHFYEVPCLKSSLRSKSSFVLVQTGLKKATVWHGVNSPEIYKKKSLNRFEKLFGFPVTSSESLIDLVPGNNDFLTVHCNDNFTPNLFYLNSITGELQATLVQYSLASHQITRFPFLHSHLYSAVTPGTF